MDEHPKGRKLFRWALNTFRQADSKPPVGAAHKKGGWNHNHYVVRVDYVVNWTFMIAVGSIPKWDNTWCDLQMVISLDPYNIFLLR